VGYNQEEFVYGEVNFSVHDMSGQAKYRSLWEQYYEETQGIIFVIDASDHVRMCIVKDELQSVLVHKDMPKKIPLLFYANKMDLPKAMTPDVLAKDIGLAQLLDGREWHMVASNAISGQGLEEGIKWLSAHLPNGKS